MSANISNDDRQAITDVMHEFFWLVDRGRADETPELFIADAVLTFGPGSPVPGVIEGAQIKKAMVARAAQKDVSTRHVMSNLRFSKHHGGLVKVCSLLTLYRCDDSVNTTTVVADIDETYTKQEGVWRIKSRVVSPVFSLSGN